MSDINKLRELYERLVPDKWEVSGAYNHIIFIDGRPVIEVWTRDKGNNLTPFIAAAHNAMPEILALIEAKPVDAAVQAAIDVLSDPMSQIEELPNGGIGMIDDSLIKACDLAITALRQMQGWIPVTTMLPDRTDWFEATCYSHPHFLSALRFYNGVWLDEKGLEMYWVDCWRELPLPQPPESEVKS